MRIRLKQLRPLLEWLGLAAAAKLVPLLPRSACCALAGIAGRSAALLDRQGRRVALSNLEAAFGHELAEARQIMRESYCHFARTMIDLLWSPRLTRENFSDFIELQNLPRLRGDVGEHGRFIVASCHYSNFEWLSLALGFQGYASTVPAREFRNPMLSPIFSRIRSRSGNRVVGRKGAIFSLYRALQRGSPVLMLVDLTVPAKGPAVVIDCFGMKTSVSVAPVWLHERTTAPIIPAHCEPLPNGRYRVVFHPKLQWAEGQTQQQIAQACWERFEPLLRANPAPWLWMYKHWRYQPQSTTRPYPFYANPSQDFERALKRAGRRP